MSKKSHWDEEDDKNLESFLEDVDCPAMNLRDTMRLLWEQHVYWTRMAIISMANDLPDEEATTKRLLRNAKDFEVTFRHFYGRKLAREFGNLITDHLVIAAELVKAAKEGNTRECYKMSRY